MIKKSNRIKLLLLLTLSFFSILYILIFAREHSYLIHGDNPNSPPLSGNSFFYSYYQGVDTGIPTLLILLLIPFVSHYDSSAFMLSHFDYQIITRMGRGKYIQKNLIRSFKDIWYFPVVLNIFMIGIIHFFFIPIFGSKDSMPVFVNGLLPNLVLFTLFQVIGWTLLNCICFYLSQMIKNKYVYPFSLLGVALGITLILGILGSNLPFSRWLNIIRNALSPLFLVSPGVIGLWGIAFEDQLLTVLCSFIIYVAILCILYWICKVWFHD